jgi:hypothetical protein
VCLKAIIADVTLSILLILNPSIGFPPEFYGFIVASPANESYSNLYEFSVVNNINKLVE